MTAPQDDAFLPLVQEREAHLPCAVAASNPDEPMHAVCGQQLLGLEAPPDAPKCPTCLARFTAVGGAGLLGLLLGLLRCDEHRRAASR